MISLIIISVIALTSSFILSPNNYDTVLSAKYAAYSAIAFCPKSCIESSSCGTTAKYPKLTSVTYVENSVTKAVAYVGYEPATQTIVTSWRGSNNVENWIEDFNF